MNDTTQRIVFTSADVGTYFDGSQGWRNNYRVVDLAVSHGMQLTSEEITDLDAYRIAGSANSDAFGAVIDQGGLCDRATEYLGSITANGLVWVWDMGELSLIPLCQTEDYEGDECAHCPTSAREV